MTTNAFYRVAFAAVGSSIAFARGDWLLGLAFGMALLLAELARWLLNRARQLPPRQQRLQAYRASIAKPVRSMVLFGLSVIALTGLCHSLLANMPEIQELRFDRDRAEFEAVLKQFEANRHFSEAAELIEKRLEGDASVGWKELLAERQYRCFLEASKDEVGDCALAVLRKAVECSQRHGLDHFAADQLISRIGEVQRSNRRHADARVGEQAALAASERLKQLGRSSQLSLASVVLDELLKCGDAFGERIGPRREKYQAAIDWCKRYGLNDSVAHQRLAALERLAALRMPINLPVGVKAKIECQRLDSFPPFLVLDLAVTDSHGTHLPGLLAKDFAVTSDGNSLDQIHLAEGRLQSQPWNLVLLFDRSGSTKGNPIHAAKTGLVNLVAELNGHANFKLVTFAATIEQRGDWFRDSQVAAARVDALQAEGGTALFGALDAAIRELNQKPGPRGIVLFTDGRDTVGGFKYSDVVQRCRTASIAVNVVALATPDIDSRLLQQLASETDGRSHTVTRTQDLAATFRELAVKLRQPVYRIAIPAQEKTIRTVRVRIGNQNAVTLDHISRDAARN